MISKHALLGFIFILFVILLAGCSKANPEEVRNVEDPYESLNINESENVPSEINQGSQANDIKWNYATIPKNVEINSVVNTGEMFVAVGFEKEPIAALPGEAIILSSFDEQGPWVPIYVSSGSALNGVAWSGKELVAVGNDGTAFISSNGLAWSAVDTKTTRNLNGIIWSGDKFVAVGGLGATITSADGHGWNTNSVAVESDLNKLIYNGYLYVAVGNDGTVITSNNGYDWVAQNTGVVNHLRNIVWTGVHFLTAGGRSGYASNAVVLKSADGIVWEIDSFDFPENDLTGLAWAKNRFIAVSYSGFPFGSVYTSSDGASWSLINEIEGNYKDICWDGKNFIASGNGVFDISADGVNWQSKALQGRSGTDLFRVSWSGMEYVTATPSGYIWTSSNGTDWQKHDPGARQYLLSAASSDRIHVVGGSWGEIFTSEDGINWTLRITGTDMKILSIVWTGDQFVAVGNSSQYNDDMSILTSQDGISWVMRKSGTVNALHDVIWTGSKLVAVGDNGTILVSEDGVDWSLKETLTNRHLLSAAYGNNGQYVAVGYSILISDNGDRWELVDHSVDYHRALNRIKWVGSQYVAIGDRGVTLISVDGRNWEKLEEVTRNNLYDLVWTDDGLLATGHSGIVLLAR